MSKSRSPKALWRWLRQRSREADLAALRAFLHFAPSERQRVFALTLVVGAACGLAAVAFHLSIIFAEHQLIDRALHASGRSWIAWTILTPALGGLICGVLLQYVVPGARGSGIPQVKVAYAVKGGRLPFRDALGKFLVGTLQIGSGASLGREGPTVQICAGLASALGRIAALSRANMKRLLPVGAAAGIAAAFNAPIAAVTFTIEEVVGDLDQTVLSGVIVAAALAAVIERSVLGEHPVFTLSQSYGLHHASSLFLYAFLGLAAAIISLLFTESLIALRGAFQRTSVIPPWMRPSIGGLVTGVLAVTALLWFGTNGVTGGGYDTLSSALGGQLTLRVMLALCIMKLAATVFSYSSGGAGGIFAPALFIGGMLGGAIGHLDGRLLHHADSQVGAFALVGMGAVFAGIIRAPITSVLIIFEMTGNYGLILPLMIANMTSYGLARRLRPIPIYEALLEQDNIHLPHQRSSAKHALEQLRVAEAMTRDIMTLPADISIIEALKRTEANNFSTYPVIADDGSFVGSVTVSRMRRKFAEGEGEIPVSKFADKTPVVFPDQALMRALLKMDQSGWHQLAVVDRRNQEQLRGIIAMSDLVRTQARVAREAGLTDRTIIPEFSEVGDELETQSKG
jgi:CIC family chloride channel protein